VRLLANIDILSLIGKTPIIELPSFSPCDGAGIWAKLEMFNPGGSVKDRAALSMILSAERAGKLRPETTVIEPSSGNTGIAIAMLCAIRGYKCLIVMPETMSIERRKMIAAFGAGIILTPGDAGMRGSVEKAIELLDEIPDSFLPNQFDNPANPSAHEFGTGPEIIDSIGEFDAFVAGIGTGGTITGVARALKSANIGARMVGIEPAESTVLSGGSAGKHGIQGLGAGFIPKILNMDLIDEIIAVDTREAFEYTRRLVAQEGIFAGISSGAALVGAVRVAERLRSGEKVVTLFPDGGMKYLSTTVFGSG